MRASEVRGRLFFLLTTVAAACTPSEFSAQGGSGGTAGAGASGGGGRAGSMTASSGSGEAGSDEPAAGAGSVGGGRGVVGGAGGMGAYGGKPPFGTAGTGGIDAAGGTGATAGAGAAVGTGGSDEPGTGGTSMTTGGTGGDSGSAGAPASGGDGGSTAGSGGTAVDTGGTAGTGGAGGGGNGGSSPMGGTGGTVTVGGCNNQLLVNGDFEAGKSAGWVSESEWPGIDLIVPKTDAALMAEGVAPYAGNYLAWLGGIPDNDWDHYITMISQYVEIPEDASSLTLSGRYFVKSIDDPGDIYDVSYLEFDLNDEVAWQAFALTNQSTTNGWVSFSKTTNDLDELRGETTLFYAYARTDLTGKTSFFLDTLSLVAGCGR